MSWSRAVWQEKTPEEEMTIPTVWIMDNDSVDSIWLCAMARRVASIKSF